MDYMNRNLQAFFW